MERDGLKAVIAVKDANKAELIAIQFMRSQKSTRTAMVHAWPVKNHPDSQ